MLLPGRNAALMPGFAWDVAIWAEGWTPGIFVPTDEGPVETSAQFSIITNPGQRRVTLRVPKSALPGDPTAWNLALVVLSQEGYPASGVWRVRDVTTVAEQWRIGGGTGSRADTRVMDVLWPEGNQPLQAELLQHDNPVDVDLSSLEADDFAQVPMVGP
jgi:carbohydrate-binding DOMON domain-containing protein